MIELVCWYFDFFIMVLWFLNVMDLEDYVEFLLFDVDVMLWKWNFWGYIDVCDGV